MISILGVMIIVFGILATTNIVSGGMVDKDQSCTIWNNEACGNDGNLYICNGGKYILYKNCANKKCFDGIVDDVCEDGQGSVTGLPPTPSDTDKSNWCLPKDEGGNGGTCRQRNCDTNEEIKGTCSFYGGSVGANCCVPKGSSPTAPPAVGGSSSGSNSGGGTVTGGSSVCINAPVSGECQIKDAIMTDENYCTSSSGTSVGKIVSGKCSSESTNELVCCGHFQDCNQILNQVMEFVKEIKVYKLMQKNEATKPQLNKKKEALYQIVSNVEKSLILNPNCGHLSEQALLSYL